MNINLNFLSKEMAGSTVPKPLSGTLSGHAAGEPFDKLVFAKVKDRFPKTTFRQYELLNMLYIKNPKALDFSSRIGLFSAPALGYLLSRKQGPTEKWEPTAQYEEKQDDTADIVVIKKGIFNLIDVKTYNIAKLGQPPNIISATKLAGMCARMLESKIYGSHTITYVGITWVLDRNELKCTDVAIRELFRTNPEKLYINWAAATQLQFHVGTLSQTYANSVEDWCRAYLRKFVESAKAHSDRTIQKYVEPYLKYI